LPTPINVRFAVVAGMIAVAALARLLPLPPNVQPVAAMALFAGANFDRRAWALAIPLIAMLLSDLALELIAGHGFHALMPIVYVSMAAIVGIGVLIGKRRSAAWIAGGAISGALLFFVATNFAVWLTSAMYPPTIEGLMACYVAALPFFANSLVGDLGFAAALFGGYALLQHRFPVLAGPSYARG
jgi:hypothetical protein